MTIEWKLWADHQAVEEYLLHNVAVDQQVRLSTLDQNEYLFMYLCTYISIYLFIDISHSIALKCMQSVWQHVFHRQANHFKIWTVFLQENVWDECTSYMAYFIISKLSTKDKNNY